MARQHPISMRFPVIKGKEKALEKLLLSFGNPAKKSSNFPYHLFDELHFGRWFMVPATTFRRKEVGPTVMYLANVDGDVETHLKNLSEKASDILDEIFVYCDVGESKKTEEDGWLAYLQKHFKKTPAYYIGAPKRTVQQIHQEAELHEAVLEYVNEEKTLSPSKVAILRSIQNWLAMDSRWDWAREKFRLPRIQWLRAIPFIVAALITLIPAIILIILIHYIYEIREKPLGLTIDQINQEKLSSLMNMEDFVYQNQLTQVFDTKPGLHRILLPYTLWLGNNIAQLFFLKGQLVGTPTIHFARWLIIDGGRRFLFVSNFDGSYNEYLGDFVNYGAWGLNLIYSNSVGYPPTRFLLWKGANYIQLFLGWGRYNQITTQSWYSAYPNIGLPQIVNQSRLRVGLFGPRTSNNKKIEALLRRI